jgi:Flp pilus assembly protein TadD
VACDIATKKPAEARARVEQQLAASPSSGQLLLLAGMTYSATGDMKKAETALQKAIQVEPSNLDAYNRLAEIYLTQGRLNDAKEYYESTTRQQPKLVGAHTMVAMILDLQKKGDEARKKYEQVMAMDPQSPVAANNLAWKYAESGENLDAALELAQIAARHLPDNDSVSDTLGWVYYKKGLVGRAITAFQQSVTKAPSNPTNHYHLGLAYLKNGNKAGARQSLERALQLNPQFESADDAKRVLATIKG